jgi:hypothetical protein
VSRWLLSVLTIFVSAHLYIWWRLVYPLSSPWWQVATTVFVLCTAAVPFMIRIGRKLPRERARPWVMMGSLWFGLALYLLIGAWVSHIAVAFGADPQRAAIYAGLGAIAVVLAGLVRW